MKHTVSIAFVFLWYLAFSVVQAQPSFFEVLPDAEEKKLFRGLVTMADIKNDSSFTWYAQNTKYYKPNAALVAALKAKAGQYHLMLFAGTWCHDSQQIIPKYFRCLEAAGMPDSVITIAAADRNKTTIASLHKVFQVTMVPTIIVMKDGKEVGRITEFGKTGLPEAELAVLIESL